MKKISILFVIFIIPILCFPQDVHWIADLDSLEYKILQKPYLFNTFSKKLFSNKIKSLKNKAPLNDEEKYWSLFDLISSFKITQFSLQNNNFAKFPFRVKQFKGDYYLTSIIQNKKEVLGYRLKNINGISINSIIKKAKSVNNIPVKSFLMFNKIVSSDTLTLNLVSDNNQKEAIKLIFNEHIIEEELVDVTPKKNPFYLQKRARWFWSYGINYGQQVYCKLNIGIDENFIKYCVDSLNLSKTDLANTYNLPLQTIYDAPNFEEFSEKLFHKFTKRRYKKLFIDLRNLETGNTQMLYEFIKHIKKLKRINRKNRLFIFVDNQLSPAAATIVRLFKKETHATIVGEIYNGSICNSDKINHFYLHNSAFKIKYPTTYLKKTTIVPDIIVNRSFKQYINGIDPILQKVLEK